MILRWLLVMLTIASTAVSQNHLIIFSSNAGPFSAAIEGLNSEASMQQEVKFRSLEKDTLSISITTQNGNLNLKRTVFLLEKGRPVKNKEFVYSLELIPETKKLKLVFVSAFDVKPLPDPLLPARPAEDTTYKWRNNVFGTLFELKEGKAIFYFNVPKGGDCKEEMTQTNLTHAVTFLARVKADFEKYDHAKDIVKNNCLSCAQLAVLLRSITYELDKLKLVKDAYVNLTDKKELKTLEKSFRFESSKKEFGYMLKDPNSMIPAKNKINCVKAETDSVVQELASNIKLFQTDYEKFKFLKEKGSALCYTSVQFKSILGIFIHDREKLDLLKLFYNNVTDKENLMILKDIFSYRESVDNLEDILKTN
jgi:hypothetical protein